MSSVAIEQAPPGVNPESDTKTRPVTNPHNPFRSNLYPQGNTPGPGQPPSVQNLTLNSNIAKGNYEPKPNVPTKSTNSMKRRRTPSNPHTSSENIWKVPPPIPPSGWANWWKSITRPLKINNHVAPSPGKSRLPHPSLYPWAQLQVTPAVPALS